MRLWIDSDACPKQVREIICRAAQRLQINAYFVANQSISLPHSAYLFSVQVPAGFDEADNALYERCELGDLLITADIVLADRVLKKEAKIKVLSFHGELFTAQNIQQRLAMRNLMQSLRDDYALHSKGKPPFDNKAAKAFADALDKCLSAKA